MWVAPSNVSQAEGGLREKLWVLSHCLGISPASSSTLLLLLLLLYSFTEIRTKILGVSTVDWEPVTLQVSSTLLWQVGTADISTCGSGSYQVLSPSSIRATVRLPGSYCVDKSNKYSLSTYSLYHIHHSLRLEGLSSWTLGSQQLVKVALLRGHLVWGSASQPSGLPPRTGWSQNSKVSLFFNLWESSS